MLSGLHARAQPPIYLNKTKKKKKKSLLSLSHVLINSRSTNDPKNEIFHIFSVQKRKSLKVNWPTRLAIHLRCTHCKQAQTCIVAAAAFTHVVAVVTEHAQSTSWETLACGALVSAAAENNAASDHIRTSPLNQVTDTIIRLWISAFPSCNPRALICLRRGWKANFFPQKWANLAGFGAN